MKGILELLRRHLFLILCGGAACGGVALGITAMGAMPDVEKGLEDAASLYRSLDGLRSQGANQAKIDAQNDRIRLIQEDLDAVLLRARALYGYEPLLEDVFPQSGTEIRNRFREQYAGAMRGLLDSLHWGGPPTTQDIDDAVDKIKDEAFRDEQHAADADAKLPDAPEAMPSFSPSGVLTEAGAKVDAEARASIAAAQGIYCYAIPPDAPLVPGRADSLDFHSSMIVIGDAVAPEPDQMWWAQVGYWIQKDVIEAIAAINDEAASAAKANELHRWVGIVPVKDIVSIRLSDGYIQADEEQYFGAAPRGYGEAMPPGTGNTVFTHSVSGSSYEVMQFTVKLIMDQRDIPALVDKLCSNKFHTLLRVAYEAITANREMVGKIYGSEPTVTVVMDFETIMLGDVFRPLMPDEICEQYGISCPRADKVEGTDDED